MKSRNAWAGFETRLNYSGISLSLSTPEAYKPLAAPKATRVPGSAFRVQRLQNAKGAPSGTPCFNLDPIKGIY